LIISAALIFSILVIGCAGIECKPTIKINYNQSISFIKEVFDPTREIAIESVIDSGISPGIDCKF
jgi:hypothetical protein